MARYRPEGTWGRTIGTLHGGRPASRRRSRCATDAGRCASHWDGIARTRNECEQVRSMVERSWAGQCGLDARHRDVAAALDGYPRPTRAGALDERGLAQRLRRRWLSKRLVAGSRLSSRKQASTGVLPVRSRGCWIKTANHVKGWSGAT